MKNDYLTYYGQHAISPVRQNLDDLSLHYERRRKLYRQCGIPMLAFRDADVLEVGPGGGYNTIALFKFLDVYQEDRSSRGHVDLVEPNSQGVNDMKALFVKHAISEDRYRIHSCQIEDFLTEKKYDFVFAEGFVQFLDNAREIIQKLAYLTKSNGILMFTCCDDVCMFIEAIKRLLGVILTQEIDDYSKKVEKLVSVFEPQLRQLRGVSRPAVDWVQDQLMNPAVANGRELTVADAIDAVGDGFYMLGASPQMFTDYSWYKDIWYDTQMSFKEQFRQKWLSLLMAGMPECVLTVDQVDALVADLRKIRSLANGYESNRNVNLLKDIQSVMATMESKVVNLPNEFIMVFREIKELLKEAIRGEIHMENYPHFCTAFGRTIQYVAFEKK